MTKEEIKELPEYLRLFVKSMPLWCQRAVRLDEDTNSLIFHAPEIKKYDKGGVVPWKQFVLANETIGDIIEGFSYELILAEDFGCYIIDGSGEKKHYYYSSFKEIDYLWEVKI